MEKKRKIPDKSAANPVQFQLRPPLKAQPVLNDKDKAILEDVEHIIWNPDRLKKLRDGGKARQGK